MRRSKTEDLSRFVLRILKQKRLSQRDVVLRSGGKIAKAYVSGIISGKVTNLSRDKFMALARGLDVNVIDLFTAACGPIEQSASEQAGTGPPDSLILLDLMQKVVVAPELMEILQDAARLLPEERRAVLNSIKTLIEVRQKSKRRKKPN